MATSPPAGALVKRHSATDVALMPPPPLKRIKRPATVLDEDEYTAALSDIIARDYFPGLLESQAQHEYLAALESGNESWVAEAAQKLRNAAAPPPSSSRREGMKRGASARNTRFAGTPGATPAGTPRRTAGAGVADTPVGFTGSETPVTVAGSEFSTDEETSERKDRLAASLLSLGAFQAKYTSEDNESFNTLLDKQNHKRRQKHAHLWTSDQRIPTARQIAHRAREARLLKQREDDEAVGKSLVPMTSGATDSRPAKPDTWTIKRPDNTFMFHASSVDEDGVQTVQEVKEQTSKAGPKHVVHANTRFPPTQYMDDPGPIPPSPSLNTEIVADRDLQRIKPSNTSLPGSETPRVNGYAFVEEDEAQNLPEEPARPAPSYRDLLAGQAGDGTPNPFKIGALRPREDLHLRMLEKQAQRAREKERDTRSPLTQRAKTPASIAQGDTPAAGSNTPLRAGNMTPAARRLMEKLGAKTPLRGGAATDGGLTQTVVENMDMWTPGRTRTSRRRNHPNAAK